MRARAALEDYERELNAAYGPYYKVGPGLRPPHLAPRGDAALRRPRHALGAAHEPLLRIMANLMRPDAAGPAELGYRAMELVSRLLPDSEGLESPAA